MQNPILFLSIIRIGFFQKLFYTQSVNKNPIPYLIAVDGGGTGCRVVIARPEGGILASAEAGPANIATASGTALQTIIQTASEAWQKAGKSFRSSSLPEQNTGGRTILKTCRICKKRPVGTAHVPDSISSRR